MPARTARSHGSTWHRCRWARQYRVDWRHEQLRRTFRFKGTLLAIEETPAADEPAEPQTSLAFEVKPRFGAATVQRVELATIRTIEPA